MDLLRHVLPALIAGCLAGLAATLGLVTLNVGSLRDLMFASDGGWIGLILMAVGFVVTFGSAAVGGEIIRLGRDDT